MEIRVLVEADRARVEAFLLRHRDSSMFLRANLRRRGFAFTGAPYEATYVAAFEASQIAAVAGHSWNGALMMQAPVFAGEVARAVVEASGRQVTGFSGPCEHVRRARAALALDSVAARLDADEDLYALELAQLQSPQRMSEANICRPAAAHDRDELVRWRTAYNIEALGSPDEERTRTDAATFLDAQLQAGHAWVAASGEQLLSLSAFNAALPDIVQLGGIYTPPELRGRSYAKHAVAAQLRAARERGATRSVLFTKNPSAVRCYEALGFRRTGEFALILLR